jgi:RND family efflux transporter MFP subunit
VASPIAVFTTTVGQEAGAQARTFTAVVRARVETDIGFRAAGKVVERLVDVGDKVQSGQAMARLDTADYKLALQAALDQAQAAAIDAGQSAADEARFRRLLADGSVSVADHERQKARADAAAARLEQAHRQVELTRNRESYATLVAPYAGVVTALRVEHGQVVAEGQPVVYLAREGEREVVADLPEDLFSVVRQLSARALPWGDSKSPVQLQVREVSPVANPQGRTYRVRYAAAPGSQAQMATMPLGSTIQLMLSAARPASPAIALPVTALIKASGTPGVWTLGPSGSNVVFAPVQVVAHDEAHVYLTGLEPGSRVVTVGAQKLDAKTPVRPIERDAAVVETAKGGN